MADEQLNRLQSALADRYAVQRELGSGGMATVYLAEDIRHERHVALEVLKPDLAHALGPERFLREIGAHEYDTAAPSALLRRLPTSVARFCRAVIASFMLVVVLSCGGTDGEDQTAFTPPPTPPTHSEGEALFDENCAACHGTAGAGSEQGPPLVHRIYEPSHHADEAFYRAAAFGVRAHHWRFGDMPAVSGIQRQQVAYIVGYLRWLQRQAGIE